jgi:hypothetical protein
MKGRAFIAAKLPPPTEWLLLKDRDALPEGYAVFGSIEVGRAELPALTVETSANRLRGRLGLPAPRPTLCEACPYLARREKPS